MVLTTMSQEPRLCKELKLCQDDSLGAIARLHGQKKERGGGGVLFVKQGSDLQVLVKEDEVASAVAGGVAHGADHDVPRAEAVRGVHVGQACRLLDVLRLRSLC